MVATNTWVALGTPLFRSQSCLDPSLSHSSLSQKKKILLGEGLAALRWSLLRAGRGTTNNFFCRCCSGSEVSFEWNWNRWNRHFSEVDHAENITCFLKGLGFDNDNVKTVRAREGKFKWLKPRGSETSLA